MRGAQEPQKELIVSDQPVQLGEIHGSGAVGLQREKVAIVRYVSFLVSDGFISQREFSVQHEVSRAAALAVPGC